MKLGPSVKVIRLYADTIRLYILFGGIWPSGSVKIVKIRWVYILLEGGLLIIKFNN